MADQHRKVYPEPVPKENTSKTSAQRKFLVDGMEGNIVEITAQLSVPHEGGWGWVVVGASFLILALVDGVVFSFGSIVSSLTSEFEIPVAIGGLINASTLAVSYSAGPLVSALINRFGFRACAMGGSVLSAFVLFSCYFIEVFAIFYVFYGLVAGFGYCCIQMSTILVLGFYFQKKRALALSLAFCGSSVGVMVMSPLNVFVVSKCSWRTVLIMQAGLLGVIYFLAMTFRPLLSLAVVTTINNIPSKSVAVLPPVTKDEIKDSLQSESNKTLKAAKSEAFFQAASNVKYPTAADVVASLPPDTTNSQNAGPSTQSYSRLRVTSKNNEIGRIQKQQLKQLGPNIDVEQVVKRRKKRRSVVCFEWCCQWEEHASEQRPLYRDDVFYEGSIKRLPVYQKNVAFVPEAEKTGLEYQLAVSRAAAVDDLQERKGFFTKSVRRVLASMLDISLLQRYSFLLVCLSGFLCFLGFLVPFLCSFERAVQKGLNPELAKFLVSCISFSVLATRLIFAVVSNKFHPAYSYAACHIASGIALVCSNFYFVLWYQFLMSGLFGIFGGLLPTLRNLMLVQLYDLERLTNATGLLLLFCGIGSFIGAPCFIALSQALNVSLEFYLAGILLILAGVILVFVPKMARKENVNLDNLNVFNVVDEVV